MNKRRFHFISRKELLILAAVLVAAVAALLILGKLGEKGNCAVIRCGDVTETVSLDNNREFTVDGCGETVFEVSDGKIRIKTAVCPDKICSETGYISRAGQSIVCVPEKIVIAISGAESDENTADVTVG